LRGHHGGRGVVFAGNQLDVVFLAGVFGLDGCKQFGIGLFNEDVAVVHGSPLMTMGLGPSGYHPAMVERKDCPGERLNVRTLLMHATARFPVVFHVHPTCQLVLEWAYRQSRAGRSVMDADRPRM
jgi:hypothetical protein